MLARLWWKEYRVFGPVWVILGVAAGLLQWLFLSVNSADARSGALTVASVSWAVLYAFAAGAAAFAGERESKTLGFLDALPVGRWTLWLGKASFALVSTFGLALALGVMAALGTETRDPVERYSYTDIVRVFGTILLEAVAWSLLWSSLSRNPLIAGVMGVLSLYGSAFAADRIAAPSHLLASNDFVAPEAVATRLLIALGALVVSGLVMAWRPSAFRRTKRKEVRPEAPTIPIRASSTGRSLIWQARREGWTTWILVAVVGLVLPVCSWLGDYPFDGLMDVILAVLGSLVAGVSVFGTENASGSRRFLVQHGVAPGTVWWRKLLVWGLAIGSIFGVGVWFFGRGGMVEGVVLLSVGLLDGFAVGLLCGMTITRRMTAALVGVIVLIAVAPLQIAAAVNAMVPTWSVFLVPAIFVTASRAWASDWMLEREGVRPWLRLGAWLAIPFAMLAAGFVYHRAYGVPDVGPQFVGSNLQGAAISPDQDAAEAYRRAVALVRPELNLFNAENRTKSPELDAMIQDGWDPAQALVVGYWKDNQAAIDQARKASSLPQGRFEDVSMMTVATGSGRLIRDIESIAQLLALDTRERLARGDLPGAWDDLLAQLRMSSQLQANMPTISRLFLANRIHHQAVGLAFDWLGDTGQSGVTVLRALADLKSLPPIPNLAATMQVESAIIERSLELPADELAAMLLPEQSMGRPSSFQLLWFARVVAAPWERQRTRRVCRLLIARELPDVVLEPYQRGSNSALRDFRQSEYWQTGWNLSRFLLPYFTGVVDNLDREVVGRRALEQAVAIEAWKLAHDGQYPETLEVLVPGLLARLPLDPYSGKPFGYVRSDGRAIFDAFLSERAPTPRHRPTRPGQPLLYSVGPDLRDDRGRAFLDPNQINPSDYVFAIP